ncbi:MAG: hypothetical protein Q4A62_00385 [Eikenella sp.]|nr:hypothetical protein [Eikenella sp.]
MARLILSVDTGRLRQLKNVLPSQQKPFAGCGVFDDRLVSCINLHLVSHAAHLGLGDIRPD